MGNFSIIGNLVRRSVRVNYDSVNFSIPASFSGINNGRSQLNGYFVDIYLLSPYRSFTVLKPVPGMLPQFSAKGFVLRDELMDAFVGNHGYIVQCWLAENLLGRPLFVCKSVPDMPFHSMGELTVALVTLFAYVTEFLYFLCRIATFIFIANYFSVNTAH
ncbi:hypothetical protein EZS27_031023 [termite gut metagenome]|uniref:Uncharacterized protein n=1 Tax=termite gut metagenome TaxID=433724 RepID=A0A5J4QE10_9ZZZZ